MNGKIQITLFTFSKNKIFLIKNNISRYFQNFYLFNHLLIIYAKGKERDYIKHHLETVMNTNFLQEK